MIPPYLSLPAAELGRGHSVCVEVFPDAATLAEAMAQTLFEEIATARRSGRGATFVVPVGPVDQFPLLARKINTAALPCTDVVWISMDEYLAPQGDWLPETHPLSFRGFMRREFYDRLAPELAPPPQNRVFPDPQHPEAIGQLVAQRGGIDVCFGGIGINGHIAFNEPPEPGADVSSEAFARLPTRVVALARETRTINAVTVGGGLDVIPRQAVTIGMSEILGARRLRFYANRPWQSAVVRRLLHGPITPAFPASFLRTHPDARIGLTSAIAEPPSIRLR